MMLKCSKLRDVMYLTIIYLAVKGQVAPFQKHVKLHIDTMVLII